MRSIEEGHLRFEFDSSWDHIEKWDEAPAFIDGVGKLSDVKALDVVAFSKLRNECLLLEIKDYRDQNHQEHRGKGGLRKAKAKAKATDNAAPTKKKVVNELAVQVGRKTVGTVAGIVGASRIRDEPHPYYHELSRALTTHKSAGVTVRVVLWVEGQPTSKGKSPRSRVNLSTLMNSLKRQVHWLTKRPVQVLSTASPPTIPGVTVIDRRPDR